MGKRMNPLEKEVLIKRYLSRPGRDMREFCEVNDITVPSFRKWLGRYLEEGIEGLVTKHDEEMGFSILPEGEDATADNLKREIMKLRIENERLKKNYTVMSATDGAKEFIRLKERNSR